MDPSVKYTLTVDEWTNNSNMTDLLINKDGSVTFLFMDDSENRTITPKMVSDGIYTNLAINFVSLTKPLGIETATILPKETGGPYNIGSDNAGEEYNFIYAKHGVFKGTINVITE